MQPGNRALGQKRVVAAVVHGDLLLGQVQFNNAGHRARQELTVMADQHHGRTGVRDEAFEQFEPAEIQSFVGSSSSRTS
ncbi:MAG: hypothetical protein WKF47_12035 [Geodermatophilaceae bacterium]